MSNVDDEPKEALMTVEREITIDENTGKDAYGRVQTSRSEVRKEWKEVWNPFGTPELKLVKTQLTTRVDNDKYDPVRGDELPSDRYVQALKNLDSLIGILGPDLYAPLRDACLNAEGLEIIGERLGYVGAQRSAAASSILRVALLRAADVYDPNADGLEAIGKRLGYVEAQRSAAASAVLKMHALGACEVYKRLPGTRFTKRPETAHCNDNSPQQRATA